jgi:hypothetical protein
MTTFPEPRLEPPDPVLPCFECAGSRIARSIADLLYRETEKAGLEDKLSYAKATQKIEYLLADMFVWGQCKEHAAEEKGERRFTKEREG